MTAKTTIQDNSKDTEKLLDNYILSLDFTRACSLFSGRKPKGDKDIAYPTQYIMYVNMPIWERRGKPDLQLKEFSVYPSHSRGGLLPNPEDVVVLDKQQKSSIHEQRDLHFKALFAQLFILKQMRKGYAAANPQWNDKNSLRTAGVSLRSSVGSFKAIYRKGNVVPKSKHYNSPSYSYATVVDNNFNDLSVDTSKMSNLKVTLKTFCNENSRYINGRPVEFGSNWVLNPSDVNDFLTVALDNIKSLILRSYLAFNALDNVLDKNSSSVPSPYVPEK